MQASTEDTYGGNPNYGVVFRALVQIFTLFGAEKLQTNNFSPKIVNFYFTTIHFS